LAPPFVLGIAGGSGSGKSTLAAAIVARLGGNCLHIVHDRYYFSVSACAHSRIAHVNFDHPDSLDTQRLISDLDELRAGQPTGLPRYDFAHHRREAEDELVSPTPVIVVEGILVFVSEALRNRMDHRVFVNAPEEVRLERRVARDKSTRGRTENEVRERFAQSVRPMHSAFVEPSRRFADQIVDGTESLECSVQAVWETLPVK
jgi:uridine kinase